MNSIEARIDKSEYGYSDFLNYYIDDFWLDERLEQYYPEKFYGGTVPTLLFGMEVLEEERVVWERINPEEGKITNCPILMCPDDNDFSCTIIIAEIEKCHNRTNWNKLGIDQTTNSNPESIGSSVKWFSKMPKLEFLNKEYARMITVFQEQFLIDRKEWEKRVVKAHSMR